MSSFAVGLSLVGVDQCLKRPQFPFRQTDGRRLDAAHRLVQALQRGLAASLGFPGCRLDLGREAGAFHRLHAFLRASRAVLTMRSNASSASAWRLSASIRFRVMSSIWAEHVLISANSLRPSHTVAPPK